MERAGEISPVGSDGFNEDIMADKIPIKVTGIPEALSNLRKYKSKKKEQIKDELEIGGRKVELLAKDVVPVKSGILKSSITTDISNIDFLVVKVGTNVKYAPYVEFGHKQTPGRFVPAIGKRLVAKFVLAQPYLYPAFFSQENEIVKAIGRVLKKDIGLK